MKRHSSFISFRNVTLRVRDRHILAGTCWDIKEGQNWAVLGPNGSGKSTLMRALAGETPVVKGHIRRHHPLAAPECMGYVSFETHRQLIAREQAADAARYFSGDIESYLTPKGLMETALRDGGQAKNITRATVGSMLGIDGLLDRPMRFLSTGEIRRILIARAILHSRGMLLLDEPFEGLDLSGHERLSASIGLLLKSGVRVMLATHRVENLLPAFTHVIGLKAGRVFLSGPREHALTPGSTKRLYDLGNGEPRGGTAEGRIMPSRPGQARSVVIDVKKAGVHYQGLSVFENLDWTVKRGENWSITGPNGSGKSTLLQMVTGDHPQAYANEIYLFGRRRGSGESIWEIKQRLGVVSSEFQVNYRKPISAFDVVLSGFFDSVGLYRRAKSEQKKIAQTWLDQLGLAHLQEKRFDLLSFGERRMILLARAVVKSPEILVLDEPCQGLDPANRKRILALVDVIGRQPRTQILYVSHHPEEMPACITHHLDLSPRKKISPDGRIMAFSPPRTNSAKWI
ncbi:MAG: ATP-binding cassette domain-containing protein [Thermodesulfobacteriota bacterium]